MRVITAQDKTFTYSFITIPNLELDIINNIIKLMITMVIIY